MHVEVRFNFTPFFGEEHWEQKSGAKPPAKPLQQLGAACWLERADTTAVFHYQIGPNRDMTVFDVGEAPVHIGLLRVWFERGEDAIQVRGVGLVLPVMLKGVQVGNVGAHVIQYDGG